MQKNNKKIKKIEQYIVQLYTFRWQDIPLILYVLCALFNVDSNNNKFYDFVYDFKTGDGV